MLITKKRIGIAIVALLAIAGSTLSVLTLSAQEPVSLATVVATHDAAIGNEKYCDWRGDGITVQGTGIVAVPANIGVVTLGVEVTDETVIAARSAAATAMARIIAAVEEQGVESDDITTTRFNIRPQTTWIEEEVDLGEGRTGRRGREMLIGYRVTNRVRIEIDMLEHLMELDDNSEEADVLSKVIDAAAEAGGDDVRIDSISFSADDTSSSVDEARQLAVEDALHRAGLYADAFGVEVGTLLSVSEEIGSTPYYGGVVEQAAARVEYDSASTPVSSGDVEIQARITANFAIVQPGCVDKAAIGTDSDTE